MGDRDDAHDPSARYTGTSRASRREEKKIMLKL
jgi:hypothetical protein